MANPVGAGKVIETRHDLVAVKFGAVHHSLHPSLLGLESGHDVGIGSVVNIMDDGSYQMSGGAPTEHFDEPIPEPPKG